MLPLILLIESSHELGIFDNKAMVLLTFCLLVIWRIHCYLIALLVVNVHHYPDVDEYFLVHALLSEKSILVHVLLFGVMIFLIKSMKK